MENRLGLVIQKLILIALVVILSGMSGFAQTEPAKKEKKKKNSFIVYAGANFDKLVVSSDYYESPMRVGYLLGAAYRQGRFFYWQVGAMYNNPVYDLKFNAASDSVASTGSLAIREIGVPITGGINFLSFVSRIVGLRLFVSAMPAFALGVGDNDLEITKDHINTFNLYGQAGLGVDVAFFSIEAGYNYGFMDLLNNDIKSNPSQVFVTLGFRF